MKVKTVWRGEPGHFAGCRACCFFMHTEVKPAVGCGKWYRVSTVGCYHGSDVAPNRRTTDNRIALGADANGYYETFVFERGAFCEIEGRRYETAALAEKAHADAVERYTAVVAKG